MIIQWVFVYIFISIYSVNLCHVMNLNPLTDKFFQRMLGRKPITQWSHKWPWLTNILDPNSQVRFYGGTGNQFVSLYLLQNANEKLKCNSCYVYNPIIWISVTKGIMNKKKFFLQSFKEYINHAVSNNDSERLLSKAELAVTIGPSASRIFQSFVQDAREIESIPVNKLLYKEMIAKHQNQLKFVFRNARTYQTGRKSCQESKPRKQKATHAARTKKAKFLKQPKIQCENQHKKKSVLKKISTKLNKSFLATQPISPSLTVSIDNNKYGNYERKRKGKSRGGDETLQCQSI